MHEASGGHQNINHNTHCLFEPDPELFQREFCLFLTVVGNPGFTWGAGHFSESHVDGKFRVLPRFSWRLQWVWKELCINQYFVLSGLQPDGLSLDMLRTLPWTRMHICISSDSLRSEHQNGIGPVRGCLGKTPVKIKVREYEKAEMPLGGSTSLPPVKTDRRKHWTSVLGFWDSFGQARGDFLAPMMPIGRILPWQELPGSYTCIHSSAGSSLMHECVCAYMCVCARVCVVCVCMCVYVWLCI